MEIPRMAGVGGLVVGWGWVYGRFGVEKHET